MKFKNEGKNFSGWLKLYAPKITYGIDEDPL